MVRKLSIAFIVVCVAFIAIAMGWMVHDMLDINRGPAAATRTTDIVELRYRLRDAEDEKAAAEDALKQAQVRVEAAQAKYWQVYYEYQSMPRD